MCPPAQAAPACCLAAKWGTPCSAFLLPGGVKPLPPFPKQPLDWEEDIQLWSWFLDRKVRQGDKAIWGHGAVPLPAGSPLGCPGGTVAGQAGQHPPPHLLKCGKVLRHPAPPPWHSGRWGHWCPCPSRSPHRRRSCKRPTPPTFSSTPSSECCWLTSSRPCSSSSPVTLSPSPLNSLPASSPPRPPFPPPWLPAPRLATLRLMGNKAAGTACPGSFALGKLRHGEGNGC